MSNLSKKYSYTEEAWIFQGHHESIEIVPILHEAQKRKDVFMKVPSFYLPMSSLKMWLDEEISEQHYLIVVFQNLLSYLICLVEKNPRNFHTGNKNHKRLNKCSKILQ